MLMTEWNWDDAKEVWQEEAREEGIEIGREEGIGIGIEKGMEIGRAEERKKERKDFLELLKSGKSPEEIIKIYDVGEK